MEKLYDRADIYDLLQTEEKNRFVKEHWDMVLKGKPVHTLLDVSIGSGNLTLPLLDLGVNVSGSDLSGAMLSRCAEKAKAKNASVDLRVSDFRNLSKHFTEQYDCVVSTGNSLPYVTNDEILSVLEQMDMLVKPGGYLYFDLRNWDRILKTRQRFYLYNPVFVEDVRVNLVQAWDYNPDGTLDFNLLFTFERNNRIVQKEVFQEHYHPVSQQLLLDKLKSMGYTDMEITCMPAHGGAFDPEKHDWYCVMANKSSK